MESGRRRRAIITSRLPILNSKAVQKDTVIGDIKNCWDQRAICTTPVLVFADSIQKCDQCWLSNIFLSETWLKGIQISYFLQQFRSCKPATFSTTFPNKLMKIFQYHFTEGWLLEQTTYYHFFCLLNQSGGMCNCGGSMYGTEDSVHVSANRFKLFLELNWNILSIMIER